MPFEDEHSLEKRISEAQSIRRRYPDRIPVICERNPRSTTMPEVDKRKYLVPDSLTVGQFMYVIRKRLRLLPDKAIFLVTKHGKVPTTSSTLKHIYDTDKSSDGFLYLTYTGESTFGGS